MSFSKLIELANSSGGTLYLMALLLLVELTVIVERLRRLGGIEREGAGLLLQLRRTATFPDAELREAITQHPALPHSELFRTRLAAAANVTQEDLAGPLEEVLMHQAPLLDRGLWIVDTVITLAPLLGLFGTIIGMFRAFSVLGDVQNGAGQVTGGIAEALIATACGLLIAMIGLFFFNLLNQKVRAIMHQLETLKQMLLNRQIQANQGTRLAADHRIDLRYAREGNPPASDGNPGTVPEGAALRSA